MQKRQLSDGWRLYPHPHHYEVILELVPEVSTYQDPKQVELAIRLGAESGLRRSEIVDATFNDIIDAATPDTDAKFVEVFGKDTSGETENGKYRKALLTKSTVACLDTVRRRVNLADDEPLIGVNSGQSVENWVKEIGEIAAEGGHDPDFIHLSPHDLRAYFATNCLVRHNMNMETVMTVGGWVDYDTMQGYLSFTSDDKIVEDFREAGLLEGTGWGKYADQGADDDDVYSRLGATTPAGAAAELSALGADQMSTRVEQLAAVDQHAMDDQDEFSIGRFTPAETTTAVKAAKYGGLVGLVAAAIAASVPNISGQTMFVLATLALFPPLLWGWHRSD